MQQQNKIMSMTYDTIEINVFKKKKLCWLYQVQSKIQDNLETNLQDYLRSTSRLFQTTLWLPTYLPSYWAWH